MYITLLISMYKTCGSVALQKGRDFANQMEEDEGWKKFAKGKIFILITLLWAIIPK